MFEESMLEPPGGPVPDMLGAPAEPALRLSARRVAAFAALVGSAALFDPDSGLPDHSADEALEMLRELEVLKSAACAAQARLAAGFDHVVRSDRAARGVPAERQGQGVAAQLAIARRESPHRGKRHLGLGKILVTEMPHTLRALSQGVLDEWGATLLARETACLALDDRRRIDEDMCSDLVRVDGLGPRALAARAQQLAQALDPHSVVARAAKAESERRVTSRPAPDTMVNVTALLPVAAGVSVVAALSQEAERCRASGDRRSRGQIMADTLVERVTGRPARAPVDLEIQLVMTDRTLFQGDAEPALLNGYGVVPAQWARSLVGCTFIPGSSGVVVDGDADGDDGDVGGEPPGAPDAPPGDKAARVWLRRLYTAPGSGELMAMDSRARAFPTLMKKFITTRDATCRTPWCDAPIRHIDHVVAFAAGGATSTDNGQGLCEACNYDKEAEGWSEETVSEAEAGRHAVVTTRPGGPATTSVAPPLPGTPVNGLPADLVLDITPRHGRRRGAA
ncbi:DUF222 domain-containing protein [Zafaria sp. Z1313]|uniref:HNH endonuclease n=1 Tax=unclassified Zafaria TaxID=2828765 RepID=UPI002E77E145|nr:DUF222 domain-containing protein [Zafaria sp. J156]MEE1621551.1 DUF222 domain-containing protein [Zafaria sp. J156]